MNNFHRSVQTVRGVALGLGRSRLKKGDTELSCPPSGTQLHSSDWKEVAWAPSLLSTKRLRTFNPDTTSTSRSLKASNRPLSASNRPLKVALVISVQTTTVMIVAAALIRKTSAPSVSALPAPVSYLPAPSSTEATCQCLRWARLRSTALFTNLVVELFDELRPRGPLGVALAEGEANKSPQGRVHLRRAQTRSLKNRESAAGSRRCAPPRSSAGRQA